MHEYAVAPMQVLSDRQTTLDDLFAHNRDHPDEVGFSVKQAGGWSSVTYSSFFQRARSLAAGLVRAGIEPADRVALMSRTRIEWAICDYAIWMVGGVTVPVYETSSDEQLAWILDDSGAVAAFAETVAHADQMRSVQAAAPALRHIWNFEAGDLDILQTAVEDQDEQTGRELDERHAALAGDAAATIVYTSGTTGRPKGCLLTHRNLVSVYNNEVAAPGVGDIFNEGSSTLVFLPMAHCLARVIHLSCVHARVRIGYAPDARSLAEDLTTFQPTLILSVPRVFEKLYNAARHGAHASGKGRIFDRAEQVAIRWSESEGDPGLALNVEHALHERLVYRRIRAAIGGNIHWSVSGGAPLGSRLAHFFRGAGVTVLEGYGLSESGTAGTLNLPGQQKIGTVGRPIPGSHVRIGQDGEILLKGDFMFRGYWQNEVATKEVLDEDGWFHTGDLGSLDDEGYLSIVGRKKELLVTSGGKNVAPAVLEDRLRAHWLVDQCIVVGDARPYIACLITLDLDSLASWKTEHGKPAGAGPAELREDPELLAELQKAVDSANLAVSHAESIRRFRVLGVGFTEAGGQLTPTLKLKRNLVTQQFADDIEAVFS